MGDTTRETLESFPFRLPKWELDITLIRTSDGVFFPMTQLCEQLGINHWRQVQKLRDDTRFAVPSELRELPVPSARGLRSTWCLRRNRLATFLSTINPNKVREQFRGRLDEFRHDLIALADRLTFGDLADILDPAQSNSAAELIGPTVRGQLYLECPKCRSALCLVIDATGAHLLVGDEPSSSIITADDGNSDM